MKNILSILLFSSFVLLGSFAKSQNTISVYCAQVNEDGSTTLYYETVEGAGFVEYVISAFSDVENAYSRVGETTDINQSSYTDNVRNANFEQIRYLVTADFGENMRPFGYIRTIFLTSTLNNDNTASLSWTSMGSDIPEGSENKPYKIYRKLKRQDTDWQLLASQTQRTYTDNLPIICSDSVLYKIELENDNGCVSRSNQVLHVIGDSEIPNMPTLQRISVNQNSQQIFLEWIPSTSDDVLGYVVCSGNPCVALDTIWGSDASSYTCSQCSTEQVNSLAIMAFDTCFNTSLRTDRHSNMVLDIQRENCSDKVNLSWNEYEGFDVQRYEIYKQEGTSAFTLAGNTQSLNYQLTIDATIPNYSFYVVAVGNNNINSSSNAKTLTISSAQQPEFVEIRKVSVKDKNQGVELEFFVDASIVVNKYRLKRAENGGEYRVIANIAYTGDNTVQYVDNISLENNKNDYSYIFEAPDACNLVYKASRPASIMRLELTEVDRNTNALSWNAYNSWDNGVGVYEIYRQPESEPAPILCGTSGSSSFTDFMGDVITASDKTNYYVRAVEGGAGNDGKVQTALSTRASIKRETVIFIPNAFTPRAAEGNNEIFKPTCYFVKQGTYSMRIYNRQGALIFESRDTEIGWDGTFKGEYCHPNTYIYIIEFVNSDGEKVVKKGTLALVE
ncbi:MAG: gliding motility-associated C-terminal domain-containing protein [Bacteroidales bacterium]|jgi:gliding motility-associated-like protein|nr:gliding motility-associated C-terminal domain-containing protein [Bacteroidales bacterium]